MFAGGGPRHTPRSGSARVQRLECPAHPPGCSRVRVPAYTMARSRASTSSSQMAEATQTWSFDTRRPDEIPAVPRRPTITHKMGVRRSELAAEGELYMICRATAGRYGDVLEPATPEAVWPTRGGPTVHERQAREHLFLIDDPTTLAVDTTRTEAARGTKPARCGEGLRRGRQGLGGPRNPTRTSPTKVRGRDHGILCQRLRPRNGPVRVGGAVNELPQIVLPTRSRAWRAAGPDRRNGTRRERARG